MRGRALWTVAPLCAAACASEPVAPQQGVPPSAAATTHSDVLLAQGDPTMRAAIHRVVFATDFRLVERLLEDGAFNDALSDEETASFLAFARTVDVDPASGPRDPAHGARRLVYAMLAARTIARGSWQDVDAWMAAAGDATHRDDIAAGFAVTDWWPQGRVAALRDDDEADAWREAFARLFGATTDAAARRRLARNACGKLALFPASAAEPEPSRRRAAAVLARLLEQESDEETRTALREDLVRTGFAPLP